MTPAGGDGLTPLLLGLDLGTSRIKALLIDGDGREQAAAAVATPFAGGEMAVDQLRAALAAVLDQLGEARRRVVAVGIAGIAESGAPLAADGRPLAPIIAWHDTRGQEVVDRLHQRFGPDLERRIGQRLRVVSSVAKLGWLVDHGVGPVHRWLGVPELALEALTGSQVTDFSLAARTGAYDLAGRCYLPEVAAAIGVSTAVFPDVAPAGATMGVVSVAAAAWSALPAAAAVTLAGHDHLAARAGCAARPGDLVNSVGTAETIVAASRLRPVGAAALYRRVAVTLAPAGDEWVLLASATRAGIVLAAVAAALGATVEELDGAALDSATAPIDDRLIAAAVAGRPLPPGRPGGQAPAGAVWNGVLAALAARTWEAVDRLVEVLPPVTGAPPARLIVCGGGSHSLPWLRAKAGARPGRVVCRSGVGEAVARGAAVTAGVAAGWWPDTATARHPDLAPVAAPG